MTRAISCHVGKHVEQHHKSGKESTRYTTIEPLLMICSCDSNKVPESHFGFAVLVDTISSNPVAAEWAIPPDLSDGQNFLLDSCSWDKGCLAALQFWYPFSCLLFHSNGKST
jgi:hypothetical protein